MVSASGVNAQSEVITSRGRIDLVVEFDDKIYIIEFKCDQSAQTALNQIRKNGYDEKYKKAGKKLILMGINFSSEKKNVEEWKTDSLPGRKS
jgi:Holliday junction resolvase-like predicted endonuclease